MSERSRVLKAWAVLSAGWVLGLNLLLVFVIVNYRSVLWGWIDLSYAIDWPRLVGASLLPPAILGVAMAPFGLARQHKPPE